MRNYWLKELTSANYNNISDLYMYVCTMYIHSIYYLGHIRDIIFIRSILDRGEFLYFFSFTKIHILY